MSRTKEEWENQLKQEILNGNSVAALAIINEIIALDTGFLANNCELLHSAVTFGMLAVVNYLKRQGVNLGIRDEDSWTPLHLSVNNNNFLMTSFLINEKLDVNAEDNDKWTSLHFSAHNNNVAITRLLLQNGAKVNAQSEDGQTSLHLAAALGCFALVKLLLANGADPCLKIIAGDNKDKKPSDLVPKGKRTVKQLLLNAEIELIRMEEAEKLVAAIRPCALVVMSTGYDSFSDKKRSVLSVVMEEVKSIETPHLSLQEKNKIVEFFSKKKHLVELGLKTNENNDPSMKSMLKKLIAQENPAPGIENPNITGHKRKRGLELAQAT